MFNVIDFTPGIILFRIDNVNVLLDNLKPILTLIISIIF